MWADLLAFVALAVAVWAPLVTPARIAVRAVLRHVMGPGARHWARSVQMGLSLGGAGAVILCWLTLGGMAALAAAVALLLGFLLVMDLAWRWLPHEWTGALAALGLLSATFEGRFSDAVGGAILGAGLLLALRWWWLRRRGIEALGLGDVYLAAGIGLFAGVLTISWVLLGAALTGLIGEGLRRLRAREPETSRFGIAFGAHLCAISVLLSLTGLAG